MYKFTRFIYNTLNPNVYNTFSIYNKVNQPLKFHSFNQNKFYSSTNYPIYDNINDLFTNNQIVVIYLPTLSSNLEDENDMLRIESDRLPNFVFNLFNNLKALEKENLLYKFEFSLYLHTNDKNLKVDDLLPIDDELSTLHQLDDFKFNQVSKAYDILHKNYNYHGYHVFKSAILDLDVDFNKLFKYTTDIFKSLITTSHNYNSKDIIDEAGFIEDQYKPVICKITRFPKK